MKHPFNDSKYTKWYFNICENARLRGYGDENHHIIPKCKAFGGSNAKSNLTLLTHREHMLCHLLLTKMCNSFIQKRSMIWAARFMIDRFKHRTTKFAAKLRKEAQRLKSESQKGKPASYNNPDVMKKCHETRKLNGTNPFITNNPMLIPRSKAKKLANSNGEKHYTKHRKPYINKLTKKCKWFIVDPGTEWIPGNGKKGKPGANKGMKKPRVCCEICGLSCTPNTIKRHIAAHDRNKN